MEGPCSQLALGACSTTVADRGPQTVLRNGWTNSKSVNLIDIMSNAIVQAKRPDGSECYIDLIELETALDNNIGGTYLFFPESGKIVFRPISSAVRNFWSSSLETFL